MATEDETTTGDTDPHTDVDAAQADADNSPVSDDREPPAADEDRNP